ncbi:MAG TPA: FmdB family zinc ribbon protein [Terracidiphilus sp.]
MPLYEYRCTSCGHRFEKIQKISEAPETVCPKCGGVLIKPLTAPSFQFKGAGWYVNDYASKSSSSSSSDKSSSESSSSSSDSKSAETKPAAESKSSASDSASKPASGS